MAIDTPTIETFSFPYNCEMCAYVERFISPLTPQLYTYIRNKKTNQHIQQENSEGVWAGGVA